MTVETPGAARAALIDRAKNILLQPRAEWDRISPEPANVPKLYIGYVLPLAVIAAVAATIGMAMFRFGGFGVYIRYSPVQAVVAGVLQLVFALVGVYVLALIVNALAPNFGSQQNAGQAHKLAAYSSTAGFLAGVFAIHPMLAPLGILGLYSLVLLYLGLPRLMKTPEDKRVGYFATILVVCIVLGLLMSVVRGFISTGLGGWGVTSFSQGAPAPEENVTIELPGGGSVSVTELEKMGQAYSGAAPGAAGVAVDPSLLQALLPASLPGGFTRTSVSSSSTGAMTMGAAQAEAGYENGDAAVTVTIVHMGAMAGMTAMAGAVNIQENREDADGYSRTRTVDGRVYTEEVNRVAGTAQYGIIGRGVAVTAEGQGVDISVVRTAVEAVGIARAEGVGAAQ